MKQLIQIILSDYRKEGFTRKEYIIYGVLAPVAYTIAIILMSNF
jgi:hypothetical protein